MRAGARAISNTKKYHGTIYVSDVFSDNPKEIQYLQASEILYEASEKESEDVAPVRHGRWILRGGKRYCSECGNRACVTRDSDDFWYTVGTDFCPACGAKMDGGSD